MATDPMRARALAVLRNGRCSIVRATCNDQHEPHRVMALVTSSRPGHGRYVVDYAAEAFPGVPPGWQCTCLAGQRREPCAHVAAVQLVTVGSIQELSAPGVKADLPAKAAHDGGPHSHLGGPASGALSEQAS